MFLRPIVSRYRITQERTVKDKAKKQKAYYRVIYRCMRRFVNKPSVNLAMICIKTQ